MCFFSQSSKYGERKKWVFLNDFHGKTYDIVTHDIMGFGGNHKKLESTV